MVLSLPQKLAVPLCALSALLQAHPSPLKAQASERETALIASLREFDRCIGPHREHIGRLVRLAEEAEGRLRSQDPRVAQDAKEAIEAIFEQVENARLGIEQCLRRLPVTWSAQSPASLVSPRPGSLEERVAQPADSVRKIHADENIGRHTWVVIGERVDGRGSVSDEGVSHAIRTLGPRFDGCYEEQSARGGPRRGKVELSFSVVDGRSREVNIEKSGPFDAQFRSCLMRALGAMQIPGAKGRVVFAYEIEFAP
ncbi:MAG: hypothetical protein NZM37_04365 [Sandaracinaceae bacterium]|nr:hypothetical protein [Sandaracinaceae bacterium]